MIVHSRHSADLAVRWFAPEERDGVTVVPLYVSESGSLDRATARAALGIGDDVFLVCSFGFLAPSKLNHRLLDAWFAADLDAEAGASLVFVGENEGGAYGREMARRISAGGGDRISITGFASAETFDRYLAAADVAVQLRTASRGEVSWAVLRCLGRGLPTVVNAHGAAVEFPTDVVSSLSDDFADVELINALTTLRASRAARDRLREASLAYVAATHSPAEVARQYRDAIEGFGRGAARLRERRLVEAIAEVVPPDAPVGDLVRLSRAIARQRPRLGARQLLVDVTVVARADLRTGIERVVRGVVMELLRNPPAGFRVEPVRDNGDGCYVHARHYALRALGLPELLPDEAVEARPGDVFLGLDWYADGVPRMARQLVDWRNHGVDINFVVYDLLPVLLPDAFPPTSRPMVETWLRTIAHVCAGVLCISRAVADDVLAWLDAAQPARQRPLQVGYWPLGATLADTLPTAGVAEDVQAQMSRIVARPSFLMVGTVEPRKGHAHIVAAFDLAWQAGLDVNLVVVGKQGWMTDDLASRMRSHAEAGRRLFWFERMADDALDRLYGSCAALIAASRGEGYGLPLVEASRHGLPIIARDIPVFREVAGAHAHYFSADAPASFLATLREWLELRKSGGAPDSRLIEVIDWSKSTAALVDVLLERKWYRSWLPEGVDTTSQGVVLRESLPAASPPAYAAAHDA